MSSKELQRQVKIERDSDADNVNNASRESKATSSPRTDAPVRKSDESIQDTAKALPLAPPPRPSEQKTSDTSDHFNARHDSHFTLEPNPFEKSFGNPSAEPPSAAQNSLLPSVHSLASPASLLPGGTPGWQNSLRSGPLSPAMLSGPTGSNDYFGDHHYRGGFPTPNESSLRTGLTPGGGGSMFPAPSPNSQALFNTLQSGGATPNTIDFHKTAMNAAAARKLDVQKNQVNGMQPPRSDNDGRHDIEQKSFQPPPVPQHGQQNQQDPFGQHDANDAANGLFLLAQANGGRTSQMNNQFAMQPPPSGAGVQGNPSHMQQHGQDMQQVQGHRGNKDSIASISGSAGTGMSEDFSPSADEANKPAMRSKGKKGSRTQNNTNNNTTTNNSYGRRKADETPTKAPAAKRTKGNGGNLNGMDMPEFDDDEAEDVKQEMGENGKKMTDEEKRKNFLERNRVAALKCRQRKKQWLANLQAKVEIYTTENDSLNAQVNQLRDENMQLKTMMLAHKDCNIAGQPAMNHMIMQSIANEFGHHQNPYGMPIPNGQQQLAQMQAAQQRK